MERWRVSLFGDRLHVVVEEDVEAGIAKLKGRLAKEGIEVFRAYEERLSLEDVFIAIVEKRRSQ